MTQAETSGGKAALPVGRPQARAADPCVLVLFGAGGDLTRRLLVPSLYNLAHAGLLPEQFALIGVTRDRMGDAEFQKRLTEDLHRFAPGKIDGKVWGRVAPRLHAIQGEFEDDSLFKRLGARLAEVDREAGTGGNALFYLATPPQFFGPIIDRLGRAGLTREEDGRWRRVGVEKPFGHDLQSAQALNAEIGRTLQETQIYRIDHYLGKETVQNILVFRFANGIFEPIWNRNYIDHVQITVAESIGIEGRGGYYDGAGAMRDMVQNHLFQMLSLVAMEAPVSVDAESMRDEKTKALHAIKPLSPEDVLHQAVRGQYGAGTVSGRPVPAYRAEVDVLPDSQTETFAAVKLLLDNWRWADVPFYLRTGKALPARTTEVAIQFKRAPALLFKGTPAAHVTPNWLVLHIQPDEGISLQFGAKVPGPVLDVGSVDMNFRYGDYFGSSPSTGYETLLYDVMIGDQTLFQRADTVEAGWRAVMPILDVWQAVSPPGFPNYAPDTWGPDESEDLLARDGRRWRLPGGDTHSPNV